MNLKHFPKLQAHINLLVFFENYTTWTISWDIFLEFLKLKELE